MLKSQSNNLDSECTSTHDMMVSDAAPRKYGIVILGASGYTGTMVCTHIAAKFPTNLKWSVAGRSRERLEKLAAKLRKEYPDRVQPGESMQAWRLERLMRIR